MANRLATLAALGALVAASGCSPLGLALLEEFGAAGPAASDYIEKLDAAALGNAATALRVYCRAPLEAREALRQRLDARREAAGAQLVVWCPTDPPLVLPTT